MAMTMHSSRRDAIGMGLALGAAPVAGAALPENDAASAEAALMAFLRSFAACDLPAMEAAFAADATSFDAVTAGANQAVAPDRAAIKRAPGMPAGMRRIALTLPKERPGPPYHRPDLIQDLQITVLGDVAVCAFHFDNPDRLGRRTIILARRGGPWRILHLHASNQLY
jgi:ketosteroid isomerase-like protein